MLPNRKILIIFICLILPFFFLAGISSAKTYRLGIPKGYTSPTYQKLFYSIINKGLTSADTLQTIPISITPYKTEKDKERIRLKIAEECDLFFSTGDTLDILSKIEIKTPLLFIGTKGPSNRIPATMSDNATGFFWGPTATIFKHSLRFLPPGSNHIAIIYYQGSKLSTRIATYKKISAEMDLKLTVESYDGKKDISRVMKKLKAKGVNGIFLFPPAVRNNDLPELIKWQNSLKLPIIGQAQYHIQEGVLGGPAVDSSLINPKLTDYAIKILKGRSPRQLPVIYLNRTYMLNLQTVNKINAQIPQNIIDQSKILGTGGEQKNTHQQTAPLVAGSFTIGVPDNLAESSLERIMKDLQEIGYESGNNLNFLKYNINAPGSNKQQMANKISRETNLFFTFGNGIPSLLELPALRPPVCFAATTGSFKIIPDERKDNYTGVIRASADAMFLKSIQMIKGSSRIGLLARKESNITHPRTLKSRKNIAAKYGISIEYRTFSDTDKIGAAMQQLQQTSDFILLYPPAIKENDLAEIVKWQNKLKFPVLAQDKEHIKAGLVGGPIVDFNKTSPKLANYIDKLLRGRPPKSLPIYHIPEKIVINLNAVNILKLELPDEIISQAEIIR